MIGKTIFHYKILGQLGAGGMGVVYKAEDTKLKRTVALKFLPPALSADKESKTRFIHEARAASALDHPNICTIHEIGETEDGQSFIAMACYEGESLKDRIAAAKDSVRVKHSKQNKDLEGNDFAKNASPQRSDKSANASPRPNGLPIEEAIAITIQIARGLARAHEEGIIHRDIKPANIMITKRGEVKILDFGLAKLANQTQLTKSGTTLGTAAYMSPEQANGKAVDQRSDIWSLGVVLYEMLTGGNPFYGDYEQAMIYSILNEQPEPIDGKGDIPAELQAIIDRALTKDPAQRYQSIEELLQDFEPLSDMASIPAEESLKKVLRRIWRKYKQPISVAAGIIVLAVAIWIFKPFIFPDPPEGPIEIAVVSFENMTGEPEYDYLSNVVPNLLITGLSQSDRVSVLSWDYMRDLLKQIGWKNGSIIDSDAGYQICRKADVSTMVTGSFAKIGDTYITDVKVIDPESKEIIVPINARGTDVSSIPAEQIDELSQKILEGLSAADSTYFLAKKPVQEVTTSSLRAYRYFVRGKEEFSRFNLDESTRFLERAIELDSTFVQALLVLTQTYYLSYRPEKARNTMRRAYNYADNAPHPDRESIQAYHAFLIENNVDKMAGIVREALNKYPYEKDLWLLFQHYFASKNDQIGRINCIEKVLAIDPQNVPALNLASYAYAAMGNAAKATEYVEKHLMAAPGDANTIHSAGEVYYKLGKLDKSLDQFQELKRMYPEWNASFPIIYLNILMQNYEQTRQELDIYLFEVPDRPTWKAFVRFYRAFFFYYLGEVSRAFSEIDTILANQGVKKWMLENTYALRGHLLLTQNDPQSARQAFLQVSDTKEPNPYFDALQTMIYLKEGNLDSVRIFLRQAQMTIDELSGTTDLQDVKLQCEILKAELALAADSIDQAIDYYNTIDIPTVFRDTQQYELVLPNNVFYNIPFEKDIVPRALIKKGDIAGAIRAYESITDFQSDQKDRFFINPKYHYRLAKLYQLDGQQQKAIERYRRFLEIWKYADKGLPEKVDAESRLADLVDGG